MFASLSSLLRKPLLIEKPLSLDIREAEQMVAKAEEKGVQLAIDYNRRYARPYLKAKEYVDNGDIGKLAYVMMKLSQGGPASSAKSCRERLILLNKRKQFVWHKEIFHVIAR